MYAGQKLSIPVGMGGLYTDDSQGQIPKNKLISARNISIQNGLVEKDFGSTRYNTPVLPSGIACGFDWWPNDYTQRQVVVCKDGKVYMILDDYSYQEITASGSAPATLTVGLTTHIVAGGNEDASAPRKLFILTGNDPVQVISGTNTTRTNLANPAADWGVNEYPFYAFVHRGIMFAFGNINAAHRIYSSKATDHEDFVFAGLFTEDIYPGNAERLITGWVYKGRQFVAKYPFGIYYLVDDDPSTDNWYYVKLTDSFGAASPHAFAPALDDSLLATAAGSVVSLKGSFQLGNVETVNIFNTLRIEKFLRQEVSPAATLDRWALYYEDKKQVYFTYRSPTSSLNNRIVVIDLSHSVAEPLFIDKDQPNCLWLMKDAQGVPRPVYGSDDGYIYRMDRQNRSVQGVAYRGEFQIPYIDFGAQTAPNTPFVAMGGTRNKFFDFIEVTYEPCGKWDLSCDVLCDGRVIETLTFPMYYDRVLAASATAQPYNFQLDSTRLSGAIPRSVIKSAHAYGRSLSLKFYNAGANQNFKVSTVTVYFREAGENQKGNA